MLAALSKFENFLVKQQSRSLLVVNSTTNIFWWFFLLFQNNYFLKHIWTPAFGFTKIDCTKAIFLTLFQNNIKASVRYFLRNFYFSPNGNPSKTIKDFSISSKKLFSYSRYSNFCISIFPSFSPCQQLLESLIQVKS